MKKQRQINYNAHPFRVFMSFFRPHMGLFILDMTCAITASAIDLVFPYVSRLSMTELLPNRLFETFFIVMGIMFLAYVLKGVMYYLITVLGHRMGVYIEADMRHAVFNHMQSLSFSFFDRNRTGVLMSRITSDLFEITELSHHGPEDIVISVLTIIGSMIVMFTIQWKLALVLAVTLPILIAFTLSRRVNMKRANIEVKRQTAEINASIESGISGIRTAKAFANEKTEDDKFTAANERYKNSKKSYYNAMGGFMSGMEFTTSVMQVLVIAAGGFLIMRGDLDYIDLMTFTLYVSTFVTPVRKLAQFSEVYMQGTAGFSRFLELMRTEPAIKDAPDARELKDVKGAVEYRGVGFRYGEDKPWVLRGIDLKVAPGEKLAVVGPSGGGKTTLCQLLERFYDVSEGAVLVDGQDVRSVTQESLRRSIGIIQQDVFIFAGTIRDNIRYGRPDATDAEIIAAAVRAEIHQDIMAMPDGYDTFVGERGVMLSGGQKQRLSIARVFLKNPPILVMDEATSALDSVTEQRIQASLDALSVGRTSVIIAHRLSTIRGADRVAVVEDEHIAELGSPQELLARGGEFARLWKSQFDAQGPADISHQEENK